uniref:Gem-associated protein 2 n=1 Tax=Syphacia muris TaxID=451379 RepID=A0A0N5ACD2_9BILA
MEQDAVFDLGDYDARSVTLGVPPRSARHYLQQTAVERSRCSEVVSVSNAFALSMQPSSSSLSAKSVTEDVATKTSSNLPSEEWCKAKCSLFSQYRSEIEVKRSHCPLNKYTTSFPAAADYKQWIKFCGLEKARNDSVSNKNCEQNLELAPSHIPTIPLMLSLSENRVNYLVEHLTKFFLENGYSRRLFEWFYGVLLVLQNPPPSDECSAIREFAKHAKVLRSSLNQKTDDRSSSVSYEFSLFIAIISIYFEQKDLADYLQVASVKIH